MSILKHNIFQKRLNHNTRHIRIRLSWLSRNLEIDRRAHTLGVLVFSIVNIHSRLISLFSFNPLSGEMI